MVMMIMIIKDKEISHLHPTRDQERNDENKPFVPFKQTDLLAKVEHRSCYSIHCFLVVVDHARDCFRLWMLIVDAVFVEAGRRVLDSVLGNYYLS